MGWFSIRRHSHTRRRPREGYIHRMVHQLRRILRALLYYVRKHPIKIFMLVVLPLVTAGTALHKVLRVLGIRLPGGAKGFGDSRSSRGGMGGMGKNLGNIAGIASLASGGGVGALLKIAQSLM